MKDIRNTVRVNRNERGESMAAIRLVYTLLSLMHVHLTSSKGIIIVEALHGSHVFCLSSHVIRNLNWRYTLLKFHILQIF